MNVLITGANGFLGSHLVERSLAHRYSTFCGVRKNARLDHLNDLKGHEVIHLDYMDPDTLHEQLSKLKAAHGAFDLIIHNVGLIKSYSFSRYLSVNVGITKTLMAAIKASGLLAEKGTLAYVSSMAALGPVGAGQPVSRYGQSKQEAEAMVKASGLTYTIFRPTAIYGPRDIQFLPLIKAVKAGLYPLITKKSHKITLIHAADVAENILALGQKASNMTFHLDDGHVYTHATIKSTLEELLGKKSTRIPLPRFLVLAILYLSDLTNRLLGRFPGISVEQYREISQDWDHRPGEEHAQYPLSFQYDIKKGFYDTLQDYLKKGLI